MQAFQEREPLYSGAIARRTALASEPAKLSPPWWKGTKPATIFFNCHYTGARNPKEFGTLRITEIGLQYKGPPIGGTKVQIPWDSIASIEISESQGQHGRQNGSLGVGPVGQAVVRSAVLHNRRASKIDVRRAVTITDKEGQHAQFVPSKSSDGGFRSIGALIQRMRGL
jgi:hypothetical protein